MGLFSDSTFEEGRKLYYHDPKKGIEMMKKGATTASEFRTLAYKCSESGDDAGYKENKAKEAEKNAEKKFKWF